MGVYIPDDRGGYDRFLVSCDNPSSVEEVKIADPDSHPQEKRKLGQARCAWCGAWFERVRYQQKFCTSECGYELQKEKQRKRYARDGR